MNFTGRVSRSAAGTYNRQNIECPLCKNGKCFRFDMKALKNNKGQIVGAVEYF